MENQPVPRLTLTVPEVAAILGISRGSAYEAVKRGDIPSVRFGRSVRVPQYALRRLLGEPPSETGMHEPK